MVIFQKHTPFWKKDFVFYSFFLFVSKGRIPFYDQYGVIRDVMQNHLTEIMTLLTMKVPQTLSSSEEVLRNKLQIFRLLQPVGTKQAVIGQYQAYTAEVREELNKTSDQFSVTPTFAGEFHKLTLDDRFSQTLR